MNFSYGKLSRGLTKAARNVNEMVREFRALKLTRYSKIEWGARPFGHPILSSLAEANFSA